MRTAFLLAAVLALPIPCAHAAVTVAATSRSIPDYGGGASTAFSVVATGDQADDELRASGIYGDFQLALGVLVTDPAGAIAGTGCEQVDETSVRCMVPTQQIGNATVGVSLDGGPGNDILYSSEVARSVAGGEGDDRLEAASTTSGPLPTLDGGPGADTMVGNGVVTYANRTRSVHVDLRNPGPVQGETGEGDTISAATAIAGGRGDDTLVAARASVWFDGGAGRDRLIASTQAGDMLDGGTGMDTIGRVGRGDRVRARDGIVDIVRCGRLPARVTVDRLDLVLGCSPGRIARKGAPRPAIVSVGRDLNVPKDASAALVQLACPDDMPAACVVSIAVRDRRGPAGHAAVAVRPGHVRVVHVPLTEAASRRARCAGHLRLRFTLSFRTANGVRARLHRHVRYPVWHRISAC